MHRPILYILLGSLSAANPVNGQTLYKCTLLDGSGVIYQDIEPNSSECRIEEKEFDTSTNVVPAGQSTSNQKQQPGTAGASATPSGAPNNTRDKVELIVGEEPELRVGDPANTPVNEPAPADPGAPADSGTASSAAPPAGGAGFGAAGGLGSGASLGP